MLATFEWRPPRCGEIAVASAVSAIPIFVWSTLAVLEAVPAWILKMNAWDLVGMLAYTQAFAFLEGALIALTLVLAATVLPRPLLGQQFAVKGSVLGLLSVFWWIGLETIDKRILDSRTMSIAALTAAYLILLVLCYFFVYPRQRPAGVLRRAIESLSVLGFLYAALGLLGVVIILLRNLIGLLG